MPPQDASRVLVVGASAAGKTTFGRALAAQMKVPLVELDALFWGPQWTPKPTEAFRQSVADATAGERWVVEGNYAIVRDLLWPRATTIVWLNYRGPVLCRRALWRTVGRLIRRDELWNGNRESFRRSFLSKESILVWVVTTYRKRRVEFAALRSRGEYPNLRWIELRHPREAQALLRTAASAARIDG